MTSILPDCNELNQEKRFVAKVMESSKIKELYDKNILKPAFCQNSLNETKIENLIISYNNYGDTVHKLRNEITFAVYCGENRQYEYFNIDGQHRMHMGIKLLENNHISLQFNVKFIYCVTTDEIKIYFDELNHDSERKPYIIQSNYFLYDLRNILENSYSQFFANTITRNSHIYTIPEFIANLQNTNLDKYIEKKEYIYAKDFLDDLIKANKKYNSVVSEVGYTELKNRNDNPKKIFYVDEMKILDKDNYLSFAFKRNNFIINIQDGEFKRGWFFRKSITPVHNGYRERDYISHKLKKEIWEKEYSELYEDDESFNLEDDQECPVYKCKNKISFNNCELGHKISRANGGTEVKSNLRPICKHCNLKMSDTNWDIYEKELRKNTIKKL
jgi:hypothetical protein